MHAEIGGCQNLVTVGRYLYISSFTISTVNQYFGRAQPILMLYVICYTDVSSARQDAPLSHTFTSNSSCQTRPDQNFWA